MIGSYVFHKFAVDNWKTDFRSFFCTYVSRPEFFCPLPIMSLNGIVISGDQDTINILIPREMNYFLILCLLRRKLSLISLVLIMINNPTLISELNNNSTAGLKLTLDFRGWALILLISLVLRTREFGKIIASSWKLIVDFF